MKRDNSYLIGNKFAVGQPANSSAFKSGSVPWNKGLRGWSPEGSKPTQFQIGSKPPNWCPVGTVKEFLDKNGSRRRKIKVSSTGVQASDWKMYTVWLWEKEKGEIPKGLIVHHLDGNSMNDQISNYGLVTRSAHMKAHELDLKTARRVARAKKNDSL